MHTLNRRLACAGIALATTAPLGLLPQPARGANEHAGHDDRDADNDGRARSSVTVSFGAGLNTAQPGTAANHHVLPGVIRVRKNGVVNFVVAGFHQLMVYHPGVVAASIALPPVNVIFINDNTNLFYRGIAPAGGPPPATPATANPSNAANRTESVSFPEVGDYFVLCNVRSHFVDGMYAFVKVR